jgi:hypothetical protein
MSEIGSDRPSEKPCVADSAGWKELHNSNDLKDFFLTYSAVVSVFLTVGTDIASRQSRKGDFIILRPP